MKLKIYFASWGGHFYTIASRADEGMDFEGSLLIHSLLVYEQMQKLNMVFNMSLDKDSMIITGLLHDVCCMDVDNKFPVGHGEKSVFMVQQHFKLTQEEIMAINAHLGDSDLRSSDYNNFSCVFSLSPLSLCLKIADEISSVYIEKKIKLLERT